MFKRIDFEDDTNEYIETYENEKAVIDDATRFYHDHFTMDEDYDKDFEVKTFEKAREFWLANGYIIRENEQGECPICGGGNISYYESDIDGNVFWYKCYCDDCDSTFDESYNLEFAGYFNVVKGDLQNGSQKTDNSTNNIKL